MPRSSRRQELINCTIDLVAERGLDHLSLKDVTARAGLSEAAVYKHFTSKELLFFSCALDAASTLSRMTDDVVMVLPPDQAGALAVARNLWVRYYHTLLREGNRTLFLFVYHGSTFYRALPQEKRAELIDTMRPSHSYSDLYRLYDERYRLSSQVSDVVLFTWIVDMTCLCVQRVLRGELPNTVRTMDDIWRMISGGLGQLLILPNSPGEKA